MLTKNNGKTIRASFESLAAIKPRFMVADLGSTDETLAICKEFGAEVHPMRDSPRDVARNRLADLSQTDRLFWIEPWEAVITGLGTLNAFKGRHAHVAILQNKVLSHDVRLWDGKAKFVNPVYERLDVPSSSQSNVQIFSKGGMDLGEAAAIIQKWKASEPLSAQPYYYHGCVLMARGEYDEFLKMADQYLFMDKSNATSVIMTRYYYAMASLMHKRAYKPALQNLNMCLCAKPLMAEFWCLMGDVYYHLLHRFDHAKEFYENAMILGSRRLRTDTVPMDIPKYREYPTKMIESCDKILKSTSFYGKM